MKTLRILGIGACQIQNLLYDLDRRGRLHAVWRDIRCGETLYTHSLEEAVQMVRYCLGDIVIPPDILRLCYTTTVFDPATCNGRAIGTADMALLQLSSPLEIKYGPWRINRSEIERRVFPLARGFSAFAATCNNRWYAALVKGNDEARQQNAELLLEHLPIDAEFTWLRSCFENITSTKSAWDELLDGLEQLTSLLSAPLVLTSPILRYAEDGRGFSWPPEFVNQIAHAAHILELPLLDFAQTVAKYPVDVAVIKDGIHWQPGFLPVVGDVVADFCMEAWNARNSARDCPSRVAVASL